MEGFEQLKYHFAHDPCRVGDRLPVGAVRVGEGVHVVLRADAVAVAAAKGVDLLVRDGDVWDERHMVPEAGGFSLFLEPSAYPHVVHYAFRILLDDDFAVYYVPRADGRASCGELVYPGEDGDWSEAGWTYGTERLADRPMGGFGLAYPGPGFQLTVFEPAFAVPDWAEGAVMYQVFPDRFARGGGGTREEGLAYHEKMGRSVHLRESWDDPVEWKGREAAYDPVDFYGGTIEGIREKLPYLASLGVEVLYLNPVFEARSNHRYDTADYERIDPLLGDEEGFRQLVEEARNWGISIVLDAVLSHTGDDSRYFNARENYEGLGAAQGPESPYFSWYDFSPQANGAPYRSWWGHLSLPEVDEHDAGWQRYMLGSDDGRLPLEEGTRGVLAKWLDVGVRGYRLDVADELPDDVLERLRTSVKAVDPQALIIGEVWEDPTTKVSYGCTREYALGRSLDSVMNYPMREVLIGFALGRVDAHQLVAFLKMQQCNYPGPLYRSLMNLLSTHDVERVRSVLAFGGPLKHLPRDRQAKVVKAIGADEDARAAQLQRLIVSLLFALPGMPCVYYGDERGLHGGGDPFCRATFPWSDDAAQGRWDCGEDLTGFYRQVGRLRQRCAALRSGSMACFAGGDDAACVLRALPDGSCVLAVANRGDAPRMLAFDVLAADSGLPAEVAEALAERDGALAVALEGLAAGGDDERPRCTCEHGLFVVRIPAFSAAFFE